MPATCGTHSGYSGGCRCDPCREAESAYRRLSRERNLVRLAGQPSRTFDPDVVDRFFNKVVALDEDQGGCWVWLGYVNQGGYAHFDIPHEASGRKSMRAHRWAYEHFVGTVPEGLQLDHLCNVKSCSNPDHLEAVTASENQRRIHRRKAVCWEAPA